MFTISDNHLDLAYNVRTRVWELYLSEDALARAIQADHEHRHASPADRARAILEAALNPSPHAVVRRIEHDPADGSTG